MSMFAKFLTQSRILLKIVIFDHCGHVEAKNFICSNKCGPIQDFYSKLSFFDHRGHVQSENLNFSRMKISIFPITVARSKNLLKIVFFDHHGYVEDESLNFSNNCGPIQDFAQICHF